MTPRDLSAAEALGVILGHSAPLEAVTRPLEAAADLVLAAPGVARWDLPGAPVSVMDGWALHAEDLRAAASRGEAELALPIAEAGAAESAAGHPSRAPLPPGHAAKISTGAVLPAGADHVVPREETRVEATAQGPGVRFDADAIRQAAPGRFVRARGSEVRSGAKLLAAGLRLGPGEFALLAGSGVAQVSIHPRPRVAILGTGDELIPRGSAPAPGQVVSTNTTMLAAQVRAAGGEACPLDDVGDEPEALTDALRRGLAADLLVTTGGASVGDHDLVHGALAELGFRPCFERLRIRPGRPTSFGLVEGRPVLVLPGNPGAAHVAFELLGRPLLRRLAGVAIERCARPIHPARLGTPVRAMARRDLYLRALTRPPGPEAREPGALPVVDPLPAQASGALPSIAGHDCLVRVPAGAGELGAGELVEIIEVAW